MVAALLLMLMLPQADPPGETQFHLVDLIQVEVTVTGGKTEYCYEFREVSEDGSERTVLWCFHPLLIVPDEHGYRASWSNYSWFKGCWVHYHVRALKTRYKRAQGPVQVWGVVKDGSMIDWDKQVETEDGREARVIAKDKKGKNPIVLLVRARDGAEYPMCANTEGRMADGTLLQNTKKLTYRNLYFRKERRLRDEQLFVGNYDFESREEAAQKAFPKGQHLGILELELGESDQLVSAKLV